MSRPVRVPPGAATTPPPVGPIRFVPSTDTVRPTDPACDYCGDPRTLDIAEYDPEARWLLPVACCEDQAASVLDEMAEWPRQVWAAFLADRLNLTVRSVLTDTGTGNWVLDFGLTPTAVTLRDAKAAIAAWHQHNAPPVGWRWGHGLRNGADLIAVATVGRAVARMFDPATTVEITRCCVRRDLAPGLVWNACSSLYAAAVREAVQRGYTRVVTYTRADDERGGSLQAAGFVVTGRTRGRSWRCTARPNATPTTPADKLRWEPAHLLRRTASRPMLAAS